ncbi:MAG: hypothetical protein HY814_07930 [Candidatus Riflebacteria bacterium]|nr:hypothetical protein [Candidatus Riflebacteria bacterium]
MSAYAQNMVIQGRRKDAEPVKPAAAFVGRAVLGLCIGTSVAFYGRLAIVSTAPPAVLQQFHSVAMMAAALSLMIVGFLKVQMVGVVGKPHRVKLNGQRQEVFVRRRPEVLSWIARRWLVFAVCLIAALGLLALGLNYYHVPLPVEPVQKALDQVTRMSQDVLLLLLALILGTATLLLSETTLRMTAKAGLQHQAAWIYLPAIVSMAGLLTYLAGR